MTTHDGIIEYDVIILGGGSAGLTAAAGMAQLGMKTALIEKEHMGGDCLYYGCVPSKTLIKSAKVRKTILTASDFGLPHVTPQIPDAAQVMKRVQSVIGKIEPHDSPDRFRSLGCEVFLQSGSFIDDHSIQLDDDRVLTAKHIIISTGSRALVPPIPGLRETPFLTNRDIFSLKSFPKSMIILGGGPIGVEMSQAFARLGVIVTIIDKAPHLLPREDADMAAVVEDALRKDGVTIITGAEIIEVAISGSKRRVSFRQAEPGGQSTDKIRLKEVVAETLLVAMGRTGNIENLGLEKVGIKTDRGFIPTDKKLRTNRKHILALGDVNGKYLFTHTAGAEGAFAVRTIALKLPGSFSYAHTPWTTYSDPELASVGYNETRAITADIPYTVEIAEFEGNDRANAEGETNGRMKVILDKRGRVIGTQIAAAHAGELLLPSLFAVKERWKFTKLMGPTYPYPIMGELHRRAAGNYASPKLFNARVRKILRVLYRYRGVI